MPGFSFKTNPDGSVTTVVDGEVYSGPDRGKVKVPGRTGPYNVLQDPNLAPVIGLANPISAVMGAGASLGAFGAGVSEFARTGNILRTWDAAGRSYARSLETTPILGANRVIYNATRNLGVSLFGNLPVSGTRRPGQADSPILGFIPSPPKAKSQGAVEDIVTDLVQNAIMFIPVARGVGMAATAARSIPTVARAVSTVGAVGRIPSTLGSMAAATEGIGGVSGALTAAAKVAQTTGNIAARGSQGAVAGAITAATGFTPGERTDASAIIDLAKTNPQVKAALDWVDKTAGTPIHNALVKLVLSSPNDTEFSARLKNGVLDLGVGAALENVLYYTGLLARSVINRGRAANRAAQAAQEAVPTTEVSPASQQTVDVTAEPVTPAPAPAPRRGPAPPFNPAEAKPPRATIITPFNQGGGIQRDLGVMPPGPPTPASVVTPPQQPPAATAPATVYADPWAEVADADADVKRLADETATKVAALGNTVPAELGPVAPERRGGWLPAYSQVQEMAANDILAAPQLLQFKAEGRLSKTGTSGSLKEAAEYNPLFGKVISVWENPADGKVYVVNGHNRLALAKRSGTEKVLVWKIEAATAEEARAIGAMENIAEGNGTAWDAAKIMRDMNIGAEELKTRGIDLKGPVARDSIPLSRLPQNVFDQGVTGKLSLDKAIALGSEPLDEAVIQDVYARATKGKWSAPKINQAIQEAKFADVKIDDGGTLPGMSEWFKTTNFNELLDVRTELFKRMREEMIALTSAAREGRKQYLEQAGNVIDVEGSRQAKDKAQAALDLFNRVAGSEGPVRDLLKEMAGLVSKKRSASSLADEYLPQIRQAIEDQVKGPRLPLQQAPVVSAAQAEPQAITPEVMGPGEMPQRASDTPISDRFAEQITKMAEADARMFRTIGELTSLTRKTIDELSGVAVPEAGVAATSLTEAPIEIPAAASRPFNMLDANGNITTRARTISDQIQRWTGTGPDEAMAMLRDKGAVLDVSKVPGVDIDQALDDFSMGKTTPATKAVADAYRQFYGISAAEQQSRLFRVVDRIETIMPDEVSPEYRVDPVIAEQVKKQMVEAVRRIAGSDIAIHFENGAVFGPGTKAHGTEGRRVEYAGGYDFNVQDVLVGDPIREAIEFSRMGLLDYKGQSIVDWAQDRWRTAVHEAFHVVQNRYLSADQLEVLDSAFAKLRLRYLAAGIKESEMPIEAAAIGFERFAEAKANGLSPGAAMFGLYDKGAIADVLEFRNRSDFISKVSTKFGSVVGNAIEIIDNLFDFMEKIYNAFWKKRGWTSIKSIYASAAIGESKALGAFKGHAFDLNGVTGDVYKAVNFQDLEWGRRVTALTRQSGLTDYEDLLAALQERGLARERQGGPMLGREVPEGPENGDWQKRFAESLRQNKEALLSGEITREELYALNQFQKVESPSGSQVYTAKANELLPGYAAMSNVLPDRPTLTGIPVFNAAEVAKLNQDWFDRHGFDSKQILAGLDSVTQGFRSYEHGALNRAQTLADALQQKAQIEAARWLNSVGSTTADPQERLKALIEAANDARRMHVAIANVTRPWGQMGLEMQMSRDYDVTGEARLVDEAAQAPTPDRPSIVEEAINKELAKEDGNPDAIYENLTDVLDPELTHAAKGGEMTPRAEAAADALAQFINSGGVDPTIRSNTWEQVADLSAAKPSFLQPSKIFRDTTGDMNNPLLMLRVNNIISSGITASTNLLNGTVNLFRLTGSQIAGAVTELDWERSMYATQMFGSYLSNLSNGFRLAGHAMRAGQSLTNMDGSSIEHFSRLAAKDAQGKLLDTGEDAMTGWTINTMNMKQSYAETIPGQALNWAWKILGTGASRVAIGIDTFNATLAGHSFEHFNHMPRGMQLAVERNMERFSPEAWDYANKYAKARVEASLKDVIINGRTLADAAMEGADAQKFMDAVNFTEKISVALEPRTMAEGMRLGQARGLKDQALTDFAKQYVSEGLLANKIADIMVNRSGIAQLGSVPGMTLEALGSAKVIGPVFKLIQPFVRVPSGIIKSALRSTPATVFVDSFWRDMMSENPATRQRAKGELAIGAGAMMLAFAAMATGRIRVNGSGPRDPIAKENWLRTREFAQSFQYWDEAAGQWSRAYSMAPFEPLTTLFSAMGDFYDTALSLTHEDRNRAAWALVIDLLRMQVSGQLNKTYFQSISEFYEAALNPSQTFTGAATRDPFSRFLSRMVSSMVVPYSSAMRAARRQIDPIARSVDPAQTSNFAMDFFYETLGEVANNIPGWSQGLPPRRDWTAPGAPPVVVPAVLGTEFISEDNPFLLGAWQFQPLSSIRVGQTFRNPVQEEMASLHGKGTAFGGPRAADFGPEMRLTPSQLSEYQQVFGTVTDQFGQTWYDRASALIASASYQALPREAPSRADVSQRAIQIQLLINEYKQYAKQRYIETTAKGGEIGREQARQANRRAETEFNRQYGTPGASQPDSTEMFIRELNQ